MSKDLIGRGWAFPIALSGSNGFQLTNYENEIEQAIRIILGTIPGERVMRPEFGSRLHELVFEPLNQQTVEKARQFVRMALERWEPRIELKEIKIDAAPDNDGEWQGRLQIEVKYEIKKTYDQRSLVYPFYLIPLED